MDIGKAFSFVFDDEQWINVFVIGGLLTLLLFVPLVNFVAIFALMGFMLETARNVAMGSPRPLPRWDNFGQKLSLGFNAFLIALVWLLPVIIISAIFFCLPLLALIGGDDSVIAAAIGTFLCVVVLTIILSVVLQPFMLAATVRYLQTGSLGSAFQVGQVVAMVRADLSGWVVLWLLYVLCGLVASAGSMIVIGMLFTYPYSQAVFGHILGQKLRQLAQPAAYGVTYPAPPSPM